LGLIGKIESFLRKRKPLFYLLKILQLSFQASCYLLFVLTQKVTKKLRKKRYTALFFLTP